MKKAMATLEEEMQIFNYCPPGEITHILFCFPFFSFMDNIQERASQRLLPNVAKGSPKRCKSLVEVHVDRVGHPARSGGLVASPSDSIR